MTWRELKAKLDALDESTLDTPVELCRNDGKARFAFDGPFTETCHPYRTFFTVGMPFGILTAEEEIHF